MAYVWVQQYLPLPVILEDFGMGEEQSRQPAQAPQAYQSFLTGIFSCHVPIHQLNLGRQPTLVTNFRA